ncbi:MAG: hypothetical protein L7U87_03345 [Chlamydiales bacterium]|nr:hypothetical protein [Chlamydiales bacterium]
METVVTATLAKSDTASAILEGVSGAGKTSLVDHIALQAAIDPKHPLHDYKFVRLVIRDLKTDKAGLARQFRAIIHGGEECSFDRIITKINQSGRYILVIDELQLLLEGHSSFFSDFKTVLGDSRVRIIGTSTDFSLVGRIFSEDPDLERRIKRIRVPEMSVEEASTILAEEIKSSGLNIAQELMGVERGRYESENERIKVIARAICYFSSHLPGNFPAKSVSFFQELSVFYRESIRHKGSDEGFNLSHVIDYFWHLAETNPRLSLWVNRNTKQSFLDDFWEQFHDISETRSVFELACKVIKPSEEEVEILAHNLYAQDQLFSGVVRHVSDAIKQTGFKRPSFSIANVSGVLNNVLDHALTAGALGHTVYRVNLSQLTRSLLSSRSNRERESLLTYLGGLISEIEKKTRSVLIFEGCEAINASLSRDAVEHVEDGEDVDSLFSSIQSRVARLVDGRIIDSFRKRLGDLGAEAQSTLIGRSALPPDVPKLKSLDALLGLLKEVSEKDINVIFCSKKRPYIPDVYTGVLLDAEASYKNIVAFLKHYVALKGHSSDTVERMLFFGLYHGGLHLTVDSAFTIVNLFIEEAAETGADIQLTVVRYFSSSKPQLSAPARELQTLTPSSPIGPERHYPLCANYSSYFSTWLQKLDRRLSSGVFALLEKSASRADIFLSQLQDYLSVNSNYAVFRININEIQQWPFIRRVKVELLQQEINKVLQKSQELGKRVVLILPAGGGEMMRSHLLQYIKNLQADDKQAEGVFLVMHRRPEERDVLHSSRASAATGIAGLVGSLLGAPLVQNGIGANIASGLANLLQPVVNEPSVESERAVATGKEGENFFLHDVDKEELRFHMERALSRKILRESFLDLYLQLTNRYGYSIERLVDLEKRLSTTASLQEAKELLLAPVIGLPMGRDEVLYYSSLDSYYARFRKRITYVSGCVIRGLPQFLWRVSLVASSSLACYHSVKKVFVLLSRAYNYSKTKGFLV